MTRYPLSKDYVNELNKHPYVELATEWSVRFTPEFKQLAYNEYCRGKSIREIFIEAGFDVERLGRGRLQNFRNNLMEKAACDSEFADQRKDKSRQEPPATEAMLKKRILELEHRTAYLEQENEFLKKIQELEKACTGKAGKRK